MQSAQKADDTRLTSGPLSSEQSDVQYRIYLTVTIFNLLLHKLLSFMFCPIAIKWVNCYCYVPSPRSITHPVLKDILHLHLKQIK